MHPQSNSRRSRERRRAGGAGRALPCAALAAMLLGSAADSAAFSYDVERPAEPRSMFELYDDNRRQGIANYVTEDFLVLGYLMLLERTVQRMEATRQVPAFGALIERLATGLEELPAGEVRRANEQFLAVLSALLDAGDSELTTPVRAEVARIHAARGEAYSPIALQPLDYSQFQVRGHYSRSPELARYFRAARYAGTVLFAVQPSQATGITAEAADRLTAQAIQLGRLISRRQGVREAWRELDRQAGWWFGPADDLEVGDLAEVAAAGSTDDLPELRRRLFERARSLGRQPRILGAAVDLDRLEPSLSPRDTLTGWRLFPQRYTPESGALGRLIHDRVGVYLGTGRPMSLGFGGGRPVKALPSALELMALLGSSYAGTRLDATDERNYEGYTEAAEEARALLAEAEGLGGEHLSLLRFWLTGADGAEAGARRTNTALAFWTYRRHIGLLYSKASYGGVSKSFTLPPERAGAWLEPAAELYARLAGAASDLAGRADCEPCNAYARLLERCVRIAVDVRAGLDLEPGDVDFLNEIDHQLFRLIGRRDRPIVVDIHSDPASRRVVHEAIGWPRVVERDLGRGRPARGALFSHYELHQPLDERLRDETWSEMLSAGDAPALEQAGSRPAGE